MINEKYAIDTRPTASLFRGVFLLSAAVLCFEIITSRISSIVFIHNYAFMVVSLAILGLGCGGIFVFYRWANRKLDAPYQEFSLYSSLFAASISLFIILITETHLISNRLLYFLILIPPFFFAGVVLSLAFRSFAHKRFRLYTSDLLGAAFGSLLAIWVLETLGGVNGVLFTAILGSIASFFFAGASRKGWRSLKVPILFSLVCFLLFSINSYFPFLREVPIARHHGKDMYNMLSVPLNKAEILESRWSTFGRTDLVGYRDDDSVKFLFIDGAAGTAMYKFDGNFENPGKEIELLKTEFSGFFPFSFLKEKEKDDMLIIGPGGGREVLLGLLGGVKQIEGVEVNRDFVDIVKEYRDYNGGIYTDFKNVDIIVNEGRSFLRGRDKKYDLIMLTLPVTKSSRSVEGYALTENYLLTVESVRDYFNHLTEEGRMVLVLHHPYEIMRFVVTALTALDEMGIKTQQAMKHIYTIGREMSPAVVLKKKAFTFEEASLRHKAMHRLGFDYPLSSYMPHIKQETIFVRHREDMFHKMPMFNKALVTLSEGDIELDRLVGMIPYDISAARDNKPFFFKANVGLPSHITSLLVYIILANILAVVLPAKYKGFGQKITKPLLLFALLGVGFMLIEISFFQKLTLYLGSPTISLAILLGSLLVGMGIGSFSGGKFYANNSSKRLRVFSLSIFIAAITMFFIQPLILNKFLGSSILIRGMLCSMFLVPLGFILGVPFPTAIGILKERGLEQTIAWMYGINGTMSVLGSVGAVAISLTFGFTAALILGALCYFAIIFTK